MIFGKEPFLCFLAIAFQIQKDAALPSTSMKTWWKSISAYAPRCYGHEVLSLPPNLYQEIVLTWLCREFLCCFARPLKASLIYPALDSSTPVAFKVAVERGLLDVQF